MGKIAMVALFVAVMSSVTLGLTSYQLNRDIIGWQTRAQVSSEPNDMHTYMHDVQYGMEIWGMTHGYAAVIFTTPANDMSLIYKTVQQHVSQAEVLTRMDRSTPEYQTGLDNLRGSIRELDLHAFAFWASHAGLIWIILCWVGWIMFLIFGFIWVYQN